MKTETTRVIAFNQNPSNTAFPANTNTLIPGEADVAVSAAKSGTAAAGGAGGASSAATSSVGAFFTSKAGIILLSAIGVVVVATAVVVPVVVTQTGDDDNNNNDMPVSSDTSTNNQVIVDTDNEGNYWKEPEDSSGHTLQAYKSELLSLTQNNFYESESLGNVARNTPSDYGYINSDVNLEISYGGDNSAINSKYAEILEENVKLIPSSTTFDRIDSSGKLYLGEVDTGRTLFKHIFSKGLYGGNVDNTEPAVKKKIKILK